MTPFDPPPQDLEPAPEPVPPRPNDPFWSYQDFFFFLALCFPALIISVGIIRGIALMIPMGKPFQSLLAQLLWYGLVFSALYALLRMRYRRPFWRSLGWKYPVRGAAASIFAGPVLAISLGMLGYFLRTPETPQTFQQMFQDRPTIIFFGIFVLILGPLCEELAFRGFLMPLLVRSLGAASGIIATGLMFGLLHAPEYEWHWQQVVLIATAGSVFGWVRYKTGSLAPAVFMHSTYNLTQFLAFILQSRTI